MYATSIISSLDSILVEHFSLFFSWYYYWLRFSCNVRFLLAISNLYHTTTSNESIDLNDDKSRAYRRIFTNFFPVQLKNWGNLMVKLRKWTRKKGCFCVVDEQEEEKEETKEKRMIWMTVEFGLTKKRNETRKCLVVISKSKLLFYYDDVCVLFYFIFYFYKGNHTITSNNCAYPPILIHFVYRLILIIRWHRNRSRLSESNQIEICMCNCLLFMHIGMQEHKSKKAEWIEKM